MLLLKEFILEKFNNAWPHTYLDLEKVKSYSKKIEKHSISPQGSILNRSRFDPKSIRKNTFAIKSILILLDGVNYHRNIPINQHLMFSLGVGILYNVWGENYYWDWDATFLVGGKKNFFEFGGELLYEYQNSEYSSNYKLPSFYVGYRFQASKGFILRTGALIIKDEYLPILPTLSLGYSF